MAADQALEILVSVGAGKPTYPGPTETFDEPDLEPEAYVLWAMEQIVERNIDLFVPTRYRAHFYRQDMPCRVHFPCSAADFTTIEDKQAFCDATAGEPFHLPTWPASTAEELEDRLATFAARFPHSLACVKPRKGVNGHGFWMLANVGPTDHLLHPEDRMMRKEIFLAALRMQETDGPITPLVMMDYLPGPEVSFDLLANNGRILKYVARTKLARGQVIESPHFLEGVVASLAAQFTLHGLVNLQFRQAKDGSWKVLEINARPAGGSIYAEEYGANLIADWGGLLAGRLGPDDIQPLSFDMAFETTSVRRRIERQEVA